MRDGASTSFGQLNAGKHSVVLDLKSAGDAEMLRGLIADADVVLVAPCGFDLERTLGAVCELTAREAWNGLRAVRTGRAFALDGNAYVNRPGPRLVDSAELFASAIHGMREETAQTDPRALAAICA